MSKIILWAVLPFVVGTASAASNRHFSAKQTTTASPGAVWQVWTDVNQWQTWDTGLQSAQADGPFQLGQTGILVSDKGRKVPFTVSEYKEGRRYAISMKLPLGKMTVRRELLESEHKTAFRHEVIFSGFSGGIFGRILGRSYREMLPGVTKNVAERAESI